MNQKNSAKGGSASGGKYTYWLSVIVVGIALGFALQFVRAWTEPSQAPPGGNVGAPINTSAVDQIKGNTTSGKINAKDFCLNDGSKCLSTAATIPPGTLAGSCAEGTPVAPATQCAYGDFTCNNGWLWAVWHCEDGWLPGPILYYIPCGPVSVNACVKQ